MFLFEHSVFWWTVNGCCLNIVVPGRLLLNVV